MCDLSSDINNKPKISAQRVKYPNINIHGKYYRLLCEIIPSQKYYSKMYKGMH